GRPGAGAGAAGGLDDAREPVDEPGRGAEQMKPECGCRHEPVDTGSRWWKRAGPPEPVPSVVEEWVRLETRRQFLRRGASAVGWAALMALGGEALAAPSPRPPHPPQLWGGEGGQAAAQGPHFIPKAKNVIYLHMVGGPAQMDLYDYKPQMGEWFDK